MDCFWVGGIGESLGNVVSDAAGFKGAAWLKVFELEEDSAGGKCEFLSGRWGCVVSCLLTYQPAALDRLKDSRVGVRRQGFCVGFGIMGFMEHLPGGQSWAGWRFDEIRKTHEVLGRYHRKTSQ